MKFVSRVAALSAFFLLAGCSSIGLESKKIDYKSAGKAPTLETPPDLIAPARDDRFAVPDIGGRGKATFSAYANERTPEGRAAKGSDILPEVAKAHIERSGAQRWLVVNATPDKVWDVVKEFWQETGFLIKVELPEAGVMETDWAENRAKIPQDFIRNFLGKVIDSLYSTAERDKFRTRLEPGLTPGTTDIFISHRGMLEVFVSEGKDQTKWQPRPSDPELEAEMLRRLMMRFGADAKRAEAVAAAAQEKPVAERATIVRTGDGAGTLEMKEHFDRAWRRVGLALDRVGFTVEDRDRSKGLYFVRYVDPESDSSSKKENESWLSKLNPFKSSDSSPSKMQYRIHVAENGDKASVRVLSREGGADNSETARNILGLLYEQLK